MSNHNSTVNSQLGPDPDEFTAGVFLSLIEFYFHRSSFTTYWSVFKGIGSKTKEVDNLAENYLEQAEC